MIDWPAVRPYEAREDRWLRQLRHKFFVLRGLVFAACSLLFLLCRDARAEHRAPAAYVERLVQRGRDAHLAADERWIRLLHYRKTLFGGWESEADGETFFNAPDGKTNPEAELAATIRAFFGPAPRDAELQHPLCRFPARFEFLDHELRFDWKELPRQECKKYREFLDLLRPVGLTLVFSSYYLNNPASAFGHTFLRVDKSLKAEDESRELLDYGVDYSANVDTGNAVLYAFKGLFGLFPGTFKRVPFYYKVREYGDFESRDLWEYDLNLTQAEVDRAVAHLWELGSTYFAYYYLTENCSYHMLGILEVANPKLKLVKGLGVPVIPADTVKALFRNPGLVRRIKYRPSNRTQFRERMQTLTGTEVDAVALLLNDPDAPLPARMSTAEQVKVLDAAIDLVDLQLVKDTVKDRPDIDQAGAERQQALLVRRAGYDVRSEEVRYPTPTDQMPHLSHGSRRLALGLGFDHRRRYYQTLGFRLALHDLADPVAGFPDGSEIEFLPTRLRYYVESTELSLEEFSIIRVKSLTPLRRFNHSFSWLLDAGSHRIHDGSCRECYAALGRFGAGLTLQPAEPLTLFALAQGELAAPIDSGYFDFLRVALGPYGGARLRFGDVSTLLVTGQWGYLPGLHPRSTYDLSAQLRLNYRHNFAFGAEGHVYPRTQSLEFSSLLYF